MHDFGSFTETGLMKNLYSYCRIFLVAFALYACSDDADTDDETNEQQQDQSLIVGEWTAFRLGIVNNNGNEESANDPCGVFQKIVFLTNGTFQSEDYQLNNETCEFNRSRSGTFSEITNDLFPEANFELLVAATEETDAEERYPEITFDGDDLMRIQYLFATNGGSTITYSFVEYQRE